MKYARTLQRGQPVVGLLIICVILLSIPRTPTVRYQGVLPRPRRLLEITEGMGGLRLGKSADVGLTVDLVHNLTSPSPEWLRLFYLGQLAAMLNSTAQMRWVKPHSRDNLCSCFRDHATHGAVEVRCPSWESISCLTNLLAGIGRGCKMSAAGCACWQRAFIS